MNTYKEFIVLDHRLAILRQLRHKLIVVGGLAQHLLGIAHRLVTVADIVGQ